MLSSRPPPSFRPASTLNQRRALGALALASAAALMWLAMPVATGLFFGMLLAFSLSRTHEWLSIRFERKGLSALVLAVGSGLLILGTVSVLVYFLVVRGIDAANALAQGVDPQGALRSGLGRVKEWTRGTPFAAIDLAGQLRDAAIALSSRLTSFAAAAVGFTFSALLTLFFAVLTTFFVLLHWAEIVSGAERILPLDPLHTRLVLAEFQKVGREVFVGTALTGIVQGALGGISYAMVGVPEAALLGALTAISSLIPVVGTVLVWAPVGLWLMASGQPGAGLFVLTWGTILVGLAGEYVVRPKLVGGRGHVPALITFIALFGGVQVFGVPGLIVGPVLASVALAILRTYDREVCGEDKW